MEKILIIHTNGMGDFLMFTPAYKELLKKIPDAKIDFFITNKNVKNIIELYPNVENIYVSSLNKIELFKMSMKLRNTNYDYCIVTTGGKIWKANIFSFFIKSKIKIGEYSYFKSLIYNKQVKRREDCHFVENNLRLIEKVINIKPKSYYKLWFPDFKLDSKLEMKLDKTICIHPGCQQMYKERRWNKFPDLIREILNLGLNLKIIILLGNEDSDLREEFYKLKERITIIENQPLIDVIKILKKTDIFINSDSGLGHLYTCFNTKIISIFGPNQLGRNQELRTGPYSRDVKIIKIRGKNEKYYKKINKEKNILQCLDDITIDMVLDELKRCL